MTGLRRAVGAVERLDAPRHDARELEQSLRQVAGVNRWLGGGRALLRHLARIIPPGVPWSILDGGTGSADLPREIVRWARRTGRTVSIVAADIHPQMLEIARNHSRGYPEIGFAAADVRRLPYRSRSFDTGLLSLTLHHFDGADQTAVVRELGRVARESVIVGELERSWPAYLGAVALAGTVWAGNRLTRHDGPLSVRRAFTPDELRRIALDAGLAAVSVQRHPLFRLVLHARPPAA